LNAVLKGFVVTRYLLGAREADLLRDLDDAECRPGRALAEALADPDRRRRAEALKGPLRELMAALDERLVAGRPSP
jgi:hypothetical protein